MGHYSCLGNSEIKCTLPWQPAMIFSFYLWDSFLQQGGGVVIQDLPLWKHRLRLLAMDQTQKGFSCFFKFHGCNYGVIKTILFILLQKTVVLGWPPSNTSLTQVSLLPPLQCTLQIISLCIAVVSKHVPKGCSRIIFCFRDRKGEEETTLRLQGLSVKKPFSQVM